MQTAFSLLTEDPKDLVGPDDPGRERRLANDADATAWRHLYVTWTRYLKRRFDLDADRVKDWTRLFRLPRATRDDKPEERETIGDPHSIGVWSPDLTAEDLSFDAAKVDREYEQHQNREAQKTDRTSDDFPNAVDR